MEMVAFASAVRRYRVYRDLWKPSIGEKLVAKQEFNNPMDKHAVKVVKGDVRPAICLASSEVIGQKQCGVLEVQCQLEF